MTVREYAPRFLASSFYLMQAAKMAARSPDAGKKVKKTKALLEPADTQEDSREEMFPVPNTPKAGTPACKSSASATSSNCSFETKRGSNDTEMKTTQDVNEDRTVGEREGREGLRPAEKDAAKESAYGIDDDKVKQLPYFHGYLPREDVYLLLTKNCDYLLRISEVEKQEKEKEGDAAKKQLILSVAVESPAPEPTKSGYKAVDKVKNFIVSKTRGKVFINPKNQFDSVADMINYYTLNLGIVTKGAKTTNFILKRPICQQHWEFSHSQVTMGEFLGQGAFGEVRAGILLRKGKQVPVAIKVTKGTSDLNKEKIKEVMKEARLMRDLKHINIVRLYGVSVDEQPLYIILELIKGGALNKYLKTNAGKFNQLEKLNMCMGAARGVEYLHANNYMHMDLAARNCLINDKIVKISDFGMSRIATSFRMTTMMKLPIKWLAPETIQQFTFSQKTDIFSFGVMLFEIWTDGQEPWQGISNGDVKKHVIAGKRVKLPPSCPLGLKNFVNEIVFQADPALRGGMSDIIKMIVLCEAQILGVPPASAMSMSNPRSVSVSRKPVSKSLQANKAKNE